ncbi:hypothetical protein Dsin_023025 [Dipteronia sinensis]|uniref:Uncharacterized protein n=1 Tax=Dipteronia sinensis TaxID=43782 RepID=A0AAE0A363_9ROSI|nr:hypothetical protein Dsin_023025 [Dipteronia sinensis]
MKFLSKGDRLVLTTAALTSIPTFYMLVFKMPKGVALKIKKLQSKFFLGDGIEKKKFHSIRRVTVCMSKVTGGLGIGRIGDKNKRLLAKWAWCFGREQTAIWRDVICDKYKVDKMTLLWNSHSHSQASHLVKSMRSMYDDDDQTVKLLKEGLTKVLGLGDRIDFLE